MAKPTEVELTAKKWKLQILLSFFCLLVGIVLFGLGSFGPIGLFSLAYVGAVVTVVGLVWYIFARVMAWWNHG